MLEHHIRTTHGVENKIGYGTALSLVDEGQKALQWIQRGGDTGTAEPQYKGHQVFEGPEGVTDHVNIPGYDIFPIYGDGIQRATKMAIHRNNVPLSAFDVAGGRLSALAKEREGVVSGDQILFSWLDEHRLVIGIVDGVTPPDPNVKASVPTEAKSLFDETELKILAAIHGDEFLHRRIYPDAYAALLVAKLFPLSTQWEKFKMEQYITAKDILLAADNYVATQLALYPFNGLPTHLRPCAVASIALIDFSAETISTAHIGDPQMGFLPWHKKFSTEVFGPASTFNKFKSLSVDQNSPHELEKFESMHATGVRRGSWEHTEANLKSFKRKQNTREGVGIINGRLKKDLIVSSNLLLRDVMSMVFASDAWIISQSALLNVAYHTLFSNDMGPYQRMRTALNSTMIHDLARDDDCTCVLLSFHDAPHCQSEDLLGKARYIQKLSGVSMYDLPDIYGIEPDLLESTPSPAHLTYRRILMQRPKLTARNYLGNTVVYF